MCSNFNFNVEDILIRRLNQDVLENFFSCIRTNSGACDQPIALDFKFKLRRYILRKHSENLFCNIDSCNVVSESVSSLVSSESCYMLSEMLTPYVLPDELCNAEEELCNKYYINDNNNVVICDLSTYLVTVEEE